MDSGDQGFLFVKKLNEKIWNTERYNGDEGFIFWEKS